MKKILYHSLIGLASIFFLAACANDNYSEPNSGIEGRILDAQTGKLVPMPVASEATGLRLRMFESDRYYAIGEDFSSASTLFFGKIDGTFANKWMFDTKYILAFENQNFIDEDSVSVVTNGDTVWYPLDTIPVTLLPAKITQQDVFVTPYARVDSFTATINQTLVNGEIATRSLDVSFKINRDETKLNDKTGIKATYIVWNVSPFVDMSTGNNIDKATALRNRKKPSQFLNSELTQSLDLKNNVLKNDKNEVISLLFNEPANRELIKRNHNKIYVRIAVETGAIINYSDVVEVTVPFIDSEL